METSTGIDAMLSQSSLVAMLQTKNPPVPLSIWMTSPAQMRSLMHWSTILLPRSYIVSISVVFNDSFPTWNIHKWHKALRCSSWTYLWTNTAGRSVHFNWNYLAFENLKQRFCVNKNSRQKKGSTSVSSFMRTPIALRNACVSASLLFMSTEKISVADMDTNGVSFPRALAIPIAMAVLPVPRWPCMSTPLPAILPLCKCRRRFPGLWVASKQSKPYLHHFYNDSGCLPRLKLSDHTIGCVLWIKIWPNTQSSNMGVRPDSLNSNHTSHFNIIHESHNGR